MLNVAMEVGLYDTCINMILNGHFFSKEGWRRVMWQTIWQGLSRLYRCVQRVIWTPRTLFFDSLDTQKLLSEFADDDFSEKIEDVEAVVSLV